MTTQCSRCNGAGFLPQYFHVDKGVCFKCLGTGGLGVENIGSYKSLRYELDNLQWKAIKVAFSRLGLDISGWSSYATIICQEHLKHIKKGISIVLNKDISADLIGRYPDAKNDILSMSIEEDGYTCHFHVVDGKIKVNWE